MTSDRDLLKQALHTLEGWANHGEWVWPESALEQAKRNTTEAIAALRERLAQPDPLPPPPECQTEAEKTAYAFGWFKALETQRLTQPEQEPVAWVGLTGEELDLIARTAADLYDAALKSEAKLKERNA